MATTITMPSLGESVAEGEVGKWLVKEGQAVDKDQPLVEIMTDKADSEIPATSSGVVTKIFATEGDVVAVGDKLCEIDPAAQASASSKPIAASVPAVVDDNSDSLSTNSASNDSVSNKSVSNKSVSIDSMNNSMNKDAITSPAVRKLAREKDVDLGGVVGSGDGGRITVDDVMRAASNGGAAHAAVPPPARAAAPRPASKGAGMDDRAAALANAKAGPRGAFKLPPYRQAEGDEVVPFSRRRRIIADHMVFSKISAPHVVTFAECDLHKTAKLRQAHKSEFKAKGLNLTYLSFVAAATCRALREFPDLNSRVLDDAYAKIRDVNLGIAVDTPQGLVVPVIRNADELSIRGVARAIDELAVKSRDGKLAPDDLANKTFTISNPGRRGNLVGGAIISQPNVGILRMGEIKKRVVVVEHDGEDFMAIHPVMYMALSYDHRVVDGVHANGFLYRIVELIESADFEM